MSRPEYNEFVKTRIITSDKTDYYELLNISQVGKICKYRLEAGECGQSDTSCADASKGKLCKPVIELAPGTDLNHTLYRL